VKWWKKHFKDKREEREREREQDKRTSTASDEMGLCMFVFIHSFTNAMIDDNVKTNLTIPRVFSYPAPTPTS